MQARSRRTQQQLELDLHSGIPRDAMRMAYERSGIKSLWSWDEAINKPALQAMLHADAIKIQEAGGA